MRLDERRLRLLQGPDRAGRARRPRPRPVRPARPVVRARWCVARAPRPDFLASIALVPQVAQPRGRHTDRDGIGLRGQGLVPLGHLGLLAERLQLATELGEDVLEPEHVLIEPGELAFGALLALAVLRDPGRLLDVGTPFLGPGGQHLLQLALTDHGVEGARPIPDSESSSCTSRSRTTWPADPVLALAGAEIRAADLDLGHRDRDQPGPVFRRSRVGPRPSRAPTARAAEENHVGHLAAPERTGSLLAAEHPADRVDEVRLPEPFGPTMTETPGANSRTSYSANDLKPRICRDGGTSEVDANSGPRPGRAFGGESSVPERHPAYRNPAVPRDPRPPHPSGPTFARSGPTPLSTRPSRRPPNRNPRTRLPPGRRAGCGRTPSGRAPAQDGRSSHGRDALTWPAPATTRTRFVRAGYQVGARDATPATVPAHRRRPTHDFADAVGSLYVRGAEEIVPLVTPPGGLGHRRRRAGRLLAGLAPETTPHFEKDGGIWPVHCAVRIGGGRFPLGASGGRGRPGHPQGDHRRGRLLRLQRPRPAQRGVVGDGARHASPRSDDPNAT